jgi:hypothetical protein
MWVIIISPRLMHIEKKRVDYKLYALKLHAQQLLGLGKGGI